MILIPILVLILIMILILHLYAECSNSKKPGAKGEVGPEEEDQDGGGDQQEQANCQGLKNIWFGNVRSIWPGPTTNLVWFGFLSFYTVV